jgi:hypothetical protein
MFFLDRNTFRGADQGALESFVQCWERYYRGNVSISPTDLHPIDYFCELNIDSDLTEQNVVRLLRWKDPRMLTHPRITPMASKANPRVARVLKQRDILNSFRHGNVNAEQFMHFSRGIFATGIVWQLFLFHIARPWEWPIADQHVFRAYATLFATPVPQTWSDFTQYKETFARLAKLLPRSNDAERLAITKRNKRLDSALMSYGQFLLAYDR